MSGSNELKEPNRDRGFELLWKDAKKHLLPTRTGVAELAILGGAIGLVAMSHGVNEAWAWKVAESLITIDGLVLGFTILGMTTLSSRESVQALHESMVHESVDELEQLAKDDSTKKSTMDRKPEVIAFVVRPFIRLKLLGMCLVDSAKYLLVSIGSAFCLFGVNDSIVGSQFGSAVFAILCGLSIGTFMIAVYVLMKAISFLMERTSISIDDTIDSVVKILERKEISEKEDQTARKQR